MNIAGKTHLRRPSGTSAAPVSEAPSCIPRRNGRISPEKRLEEQEADAVLGLGGLVEALLRLALHVQAHELATGLLDLPHTAALKGKNM